MKTFRIRTSETRVVQRTYFIDADSKDEAMRKLDSMDSSEAQEENESDGIEITDNILEVNEDGNEFTAAQ